MSENGRMIMLGGLWLNESKRGEKYMSGRLGLGGKVLVFRNRKKKEGSDEPDYYLMLAEWERPDSDDDKGDGDDIPF